MLLFTGSISLRWLVNKAIVYFCNFMLAFTRNIIRIAYIIIDTTSLIGLASHSSCTRLIPPKRMAALTTPINAPPAMNPDANRVPFSPRAALTAASLLRVVTYQLMAHRQQEEYSVPKE